MCLQEYKYGLQAVIAAKENVMKNLTKLIGITIFVVVIGFSMAACQNDTTTSGGGGGGGGGDTWSNVTSFSQVNGTWKAPATVSGTFDEGIRVTQTFSNYTITFNATAKTVSATGTGTTTFSGEGINEDYWSEFKSDLQTTYQGMTGITSTFNDANHSYTLVFNNFSQTMTDADLAQTGIQINQSGTSIKFASDFDYEITYTKQS
jgi:hypothetical protein